MHAGSDIALIDIIRRNDEESPENEVIGPIRHVVVHFEDFGGHDWVIERARGR